MAKYFYLFLISLNTLLSCKVYKEPFNTGPGPRYGHELCYDEIRNQVVLFGGFHNDGQPLDDTWIWNNQKWINTDNKGPSARKWTAMTFDLKMGSVVLFGGRTGVGQNGISLSDTWLWNGKSWEKLDIIGPPARDHHRMVYDKKREKIILFGGWDGFKVLDDAWEYDGKKWVQILSGPSARAPFGFAYDEKNKNTILFGGKSLVDYFGDTWTWDGNTWDQKKVSGPSPRAFHALTYNSAKENILLFSGRNGNDLYNDTWSWDGQNWKVLSKDGPIKRGIYSLVFDRQAQYAIFYGSGIRHYGKWILDSKTWIWENNIWKSVY